MTAFWDGNGGATTEGALYSSDIPWDACLIGGIHVPGLVKVTGDGMRRVDKKPHPGAHGASHTIQGYDPQPVEIQITIWTPDQFDQMQTLMSAIWPRPGKVSPIEGASATATGPDPKKQAFDISYPGFDDLGIKAITIVGVSSLRPGSTPGSMERRIKAFEYFPPNKEKKATVTAAGSVATTAGTAALNYTPANGVPPAPSTSETGP